MTANRLDPLGSLSGGVCEVAAAPLAAPLGHMALALLAAARGVARQRLGVSAGDFDLFRIRFLQLFYDF